MSGKIAAFFSVAFLGFSASFAAVDFTGVKALAGRVSPDLAAKVEFQELEASGDEARISAQDGKVLIRATNPRSASLALGRYIRDVAKGHISWCASRIPTEWPLPESEIAVKPLHPYAIAYNYCTISYTMAFWGQAEWQKEIDRLALQGYNIALMTAGLQKVWDLTLADMGYTEAQRKNYIADDAASAWWHMGNLQGFGGPVSAEQIERDAALGKWMVGAMREVGIEPIFQGFVGLIPSSTSDNQLADSRIFRTGNWVAGFKNPDILDPTCGAFKTFSEKWYANIKKVYALDDEADYPKFLGGDLFHESSPPSSMSVSDQRLCAVNAQSYQQAAFPGVIWILQSWQGSPVQNLRNGLDPKFTLIQALDQGMHNTGTSGASYVNNTTGEYLPWVWVEVMNFGGNTGMHGAFRRFRNIGNIPGSGTGAADSFKGYGLLSEGLETNPSSYDMFADAFTKPDGASLNISDGDLPKWLEDYRLRRYGYTDDNLALAHHICSTSVWDCAKNQQGTVESVFCADPSYNVTCVSKWGPTTGTPYPRQVLIEAARLYLASAKAKPELLDRETFRYDFVEIFQQILADKAREMLPQCATSSKLRADFMKFIDLSDQILACSDEWRLDKKEARVKTKAPDTGVAAYRRMITTWTKGTSVLSEYAHRSYAGLMKHYYAARWQAFFDIADGVKTKTEYDSFVATLNRTFPTATLASTPVDGDPIAIAEAILNALEPPVLKWTDAAQDNLWKGANWVDRNGDAVSWFDNNDVVLSGVGEIIAADEDVQVGNIELETSFRSASYSYGGESGAYITDKTELGWSGVTLDDLANAEYRGTFAGAWMDDEKLECAGYHVKRVDDGVTLQMQVRHNSKGDYVKVVSLKLFIEDGKVYGQYQWANNGNSNTLGTEFTQSMTPANGAPDGYLNDVPKYGIIGLRMYKASSVTVTGALTVNGEVRLKRGETLSLPDITRLADLKVVDGTASLVLGDNQNLTVNNLTFSNGGKLVVKGSSSTLTGATGGESISFISQSGDVPEISPGSLVYVCTTQADQNYGKEQELVIGSNGVAKRKLGEMTSDGFITKDFVPLGWRDLTIDDLLKMEFTGTMTGGWMGNKDSSGNVISYRHVPVRGCRIERTGDELTVWMQCFDDGFLKGLLVTLKIENGVVYMLGADCRNKSKGVFGDDLSNGNVADLATSETAKGYGVYGFAAKPAAAHVADTAANYASLDEAVTSAKLTSSKALSVINDVKYSTAFGLTGGIKLTIEEGVMLLSDVNDGTDYNGACEIIVKGILNIGNHRWTFSNNNILTLYTGGVVRGTGDGTNNGCAVEIHGSEHTVKVYKGAGEVAELNCAVGLSSSIVFDVEEGAALKLGATNGGNQNGGARTIKKIGKGALEFIGTIYQNATVVTGSDASGTIKKSLSPLEVFKVQKEAGEVEIIVSSSDEDYKIVESVDGNLTLYTSVKCDWVANVTDVEDAREDSHGTKYESLEEAIAALATTPNGRIWLIGEYKSSIQAPEGWVKEDSPYGTELWKIAARLNDTNYRTLEGAFEAYKVGNELVIVDTSIPMPKSWRLINDRPFKLVYWKGGDLKEGVEVYADESKSETVSYNLLKHMVVFLENTTVFPSANLSKPLYLAVKDGMTLRVWHDTNGKNYNLPTNSYVELGNGAKLEFTYWDNVNSQGAPILGDLTVNGEGVFGYDATKTGSPTFGKLLGTATLVIEDGETVKAGSVENPVEIRGTGKLLLKSEESAEAVKFSLNVPEVEGLTKETYMSYFKNKVVKNNDDTYSAISVLNGDVVTPEIGVDSDDDTSDDAFKIDSDGGVSITITNPKPGLYYGVKAMNSLPANGVSEGEIVWENNRNTDGGAKTLTINKSDFKTISFDSPSVFFRIVVDFIVNRQ